MGLVSKTSECIEGVLSTYIGQWNNLLRDHILAQILDHVLQENRALGDGAVDLDLVAIAALQGNLIDGARHLCYRNGKSL